jgi:hypothetical protein
MRIILYPGKIVIKPVHPFKSISRNGKLLHTNAFLFSIMSISRNFMFDFCIWYLIYFKCGYQQWLKYYFTISWNILSNNCGPNKALIMPSHLMNWSLFPMTDHWVTILISVACVIFHSQRCRSLHRYNCWTVLFTYKLTIGRDAIFILLGDAAVSTRD